MPRAAIPPRFIAVRQLQVVAAVQRDIEGAVGVTAAEVAGLVDQVATIETELPGDPGDLVLLFENQLEHLP